MFYVSLFLLCLCSITSATDNSTLKEVDEIFDEIEKDHNRLRKLIDSVLVQDDRSQSSTTEKETPQNMISEGTDCVCVEVYQCDDEGFIMTDGNMLEERIGENKNDYKSPCENPLQVCCKKPREEIKPDSTCGFSNKLSSNSFRISEDASLFGELPWTVIILENAVSYVCVGTLIHPKVVLTAAHCVDTPSNYTIRAGEWNIRKHDEPLKAQNQYVKRIIKHPQFNRNNLHYDAALLLLSEPFQLAENVNTVCIAEYSPYIIKEFYDKCVASGWGLDKSKGSHKEIMKRIEFSLMQHNRCQEYFRTTTHLGKWYELHRSFVCASGQNGFDVCTGDGGGPLVCPMPGFPNRYHLVGITSWGIGCAERTPSVFVRVSDIKHWIDGWFEIMKYNKDYEYESIKLVF